MRFQTHNTCILSKFLSMCPNSFSKALSNALAAIFVIAGMITGAAGSTVYYNLRLRHPTLDMPLIDYDLALLFQPMLMLGISIGVAFNVMFADWMVTILLIILFIGNNHYLFSITVLGKVLLCLCFLGRKHIVFK